MHIDLSRDPGSVCTVTTGAGRLEGRRTGAAIRFLAIPYAKAPTGKARFRPPEKPEHWAGVRSADSFASVAPQLPDPGFYPGDPDAMPRRPMSEDCLYLNVWTPVSSGPHPVLMWLHGGSQLIGGTSRPVYDGSNFARAGITCVTVGHRLGAFGFLELGTQLGAEYVDSGNCALRDQLVALKWVQDNIASFGGDPNQITLGGESAGGKNVAALMATSAAQRLFHAAIVISGGADTVSSREEAEAVTQRFTEASGVSAAQLIDASVEQILTWQAMLLRSGIRKLPFRPVHGGNLLPQSPLSAIKDGRGASIPLLIGTSRDESVPVVQAMNAEDPWRQDQLSHLDPEALTAVERRLRSAYPELTWRESRLRLLSAEEYGLPSVRLADSHASVGNPTWMYRHDRGSAAGPFAGFSPHVSDLEWVWGHFPGSHKLCEVDDLHATVCSFVKERRASWDPYCVPHRRTALFGNSRRVVEDPSRSIRSLFEDTN
ncbi:carboxylesterase/lipase family protein [Rhizobium leguminosarum]|uniref:carboxylesterase/lipase family protein n=1 Tax=Rhizobium leguminosarum TaxID=384 RepID=UPI001F18C396|nr:carboxylesterase family protein [Rhizobium leguminosarum]UIJ82217.1 carboxylesterase family protein [Rhizobium leguminosarum]